MPLPLLPQNNTARLFVDYVTGNAPTSQEHTFQVRYNAALVTTAQVWDAARTFLASITQPQLHTGWRVLRGRTQQAGESFSLPVTVPALMASFVGSGGAITPANETRETTFQGRSFTTGRKLDISLYGIVMTTPDNYRFPAGGTSPAWVNGAVTVLNGTVAGTFLTVDNSAATWYSYANVNFNSYWERRVRSV